MEVEIVPLKLTAVFEIRPATNANELLDGLDVVIHEDLGITIQDLDVSIFQVLFN